MASNRIRSGISQLSVDSLVRQASLWLALPVVIFLFGWFKFWIACIVTVALAFSFFSLFRLHYEGDLKLVSVRRGKAYWLTIAIIVLLLLFCGHGGLFYQQWDWQFRNAIFFDLARRPWPVVYDVESPLLLCYYLAFFLPGALVSKLTGLIVPGDIVQFLYALWGLAIAFSFVCSFLGGKVRWWILPLMIVFAGADTTVTTFLVSFTQVGEWWADRWLIFDYYKSFSLIEQLSLIFNQSIACWVALPLIYSWRRSPGKMLLVCALLFVFAPLPCVGIALPVAYWCVRGWKSFLT